MRPDRVIPVSGDATGTAPLFGLGFSSPLGGNVRGEPTISIPSTRVQAAIDAYANTPVSGATSPAGAALAESESGTFTYALKEHWPWLVVGALAIAAVVWK